MFMGLVFSFIYNSQLDILSYMENLGILSYIQNLGILSYMEKWEIISYIENLKILSYFEKFLYDYKTLIHSDMFKIDLNWEIPEYQFDNPSALISKADAASTMGTPNGINQPFYNLFDRSNISRVTEFQAATLKQFTNQYGPIDNQFPAGNYSDTISIRASGSDEGLYLLTMTVEPCAQRIQVAISLIPNGDGKETLLEYYSTEFNSLAGLKEPIVDYQNGKDMPIGLPILFETNWPLDVKKQYWFAEECNQRSLSEDNVINACHDQDLDRGVYQKMYQDAMLKQKQYLYNRDSIISELQKIKKVNFTS